MLNVILYGYNYMTNGTGFYFDWTYIFVIIGGIISIWASSNVKNTYAKYSKVRNSRGLTGAEAAGQILHGSGLYDVKIEHISGSLTDHYDPKAKILRLSDAVYGSDSIAAVAVAAHECGHAMQHSEGYEPLKIRSAFVPAANFGSKFGIYIVIAGVLVSIQPLVTIGIVLFSLGLLFQLVTLPVEFNASDRALKTLKETGMLAGEENDSAYKVLRAAALTYVAAAAASFLSLLRLIIRFGGNSRRRN